MEGCDSSGTRKTSCLSSAESNDGIAIHVSREGSLPAAESCCRDRVESSIFGMVASTNRGMASSSSRVLASSSHGRAGYPRDLVKSNPANSSCQIFASLRRCQHPDPILLATSSSRVRPLATELARIAVVDSRRKARNPRTVSEVKREPAGRNGGLES
jgi:hypothetical protein